MYLSETRRERELSIIQNSHNNHIDILIIEDDKAIREVLCDFLEGENYMVKAVETGEEGLSCFSSLSPTVILIDLLLPRMSGIDLLTHLDASPESPFDAIIITGQDDHSLFNKCYELGASMVLRKPINLRETLKVVQRSLSIHSLTEQRTRNQEQLERYQNHLEELVHQRTKLLKQEIKRRATLEKELIAERERWLQVIGNLPGIGIFACDNEGCFIWRNGTLKEMLGYSDDEFLHDPTVYKKLFQNPEYRQEIFAKTGTNKAGFRNLEIEASCENGLKKHLCFSDISNQVAIKDWTRWGVVVDFTDLKAAEDSLQAQIDFLQQLIDTIPSPVYFTTTQGQISGCNHAFCELTQKEPEKIIGTIIYDLLPSTLRETFRQNDEDLLKTRQAMVLETNFQGENHQKRDLIFHKALFHNKSNDATYIVGAVTDITDLKNVERQLIESKLKAEKANRLKDDFIANMSHEIRTPMNGVIGMADLLQETELDPDQRYFVDSIASSGSMLLSIINDLLDFSKIEIGKLSLNYEAINLYRVASEAVKLISVKVDENKVNLKFNYNSDIPKRLLGDSARIRQVLINLLSNSVKFTPKGEIILTVSPVSLADDKCLIRFEVTDSGTGISEENYEHIFERFFQESKDDKPTRSGVGLGLAICKHIIDAMGGVISVRSKKGNGTTFHVDMPFDIIDPNSQFETANANPLGRETAQVIRPIKALIVEDNPLSRSLLTKILVKVGCAVDLASNGQEAVEKVARTQYDLIFMDLNMPIMDGFEATRAIRKLESRNNPSIIIAETAHALSSDKDQCINVGMNDYITKPIRKKTVMDILFKYDFLRPHPVLSGLSEENA